MSDFNINVSTQFSKFPAGRYRTDGKNSGQRFREEFLAPAIKNNEFNKVIINFDGVLMGGSSFLEESFGGLVREEKIDANTIINKIVIVAKSATLKEQILSYIKNA
ncbi:MAG TPA: hypothetical protein DF427_06800 [Moraxellaceae bacterium]|nr:hypothetical protein [Moraxellaceae bacterium]